MSQILEITVHGQTEIIEVFTTPIVMQGGSGSGVAGPAGKSAYELAVMGGYSGTQSQWLASLKAKDGKDGADSTVPGADGKSAYQVWLAAGNTGDEAAFLASLKGPKGADSTVPGADGKSAYQVWLAAGNTGDEAAFLASLKGPKGDPGAITVSSTEPSNPKEGDLWLQIPG